MALVAAYSLGQTDSKAKMVSKAPAHLSTVMMCPDTPLTCFFASTKEVMKSSIPVQCLKSQQSCLSNHWLTRTQHKAQSPYPALRKAM